MSLAEVVAAIMFLGVVLYALFAGADFGAGLWDLGAGGARKGSPTRLLIDDALGPVWEANHVWLIFVIVYFWTAFPRAFAATMETLSVPFALAGLGIVLRGGAFAFRKTSPSLRQARLHGVMFAVSSVVTPFFFGAIAGAVASGRVPLDGHGDRWSSWTGATSLIGGALAVVTCSFLAAVYLAREADRRRAHDLAEGFRRRALGAGAVAGVAALAAIVPLEDDAPELFDGLTGKALPLILVSAAGGVLALVMVWRRRYGLARLGAGAAVAAVVAGWGVGQHPWLLVDVVEIDAAAGARPTLWALVVVFALAAVTVVPSLAYLYWVTQRPAWVEPEVTTSSPAGS
ncbi:MAG TPA: cytochrome d ubiquinol oxidase subunit II [Acidimicrobiales bacterium]|nr:cytochrome d ubiquinol oxidase subunit II [Acidimicrobiales bacterium]